VQLDELSENNPQFHENGSRFRIGLESMLERQISVERRPSENSAFLGILLQYSQIASKSLESSRNGGNRSLEGCPDFFGTFWKSNNSGFREVLRVLLEIRQRLFVDASELTQFNEVNSTFSRFTFRDE
jgi:hypothetical protein